MLAPISEEQKRLAWSAVKRFVLSAAGAAGAKVAERLIEWAWPADGGDEEDDDEPRTRE